MKKLTTLLALIIIFASCQKTNTTPTNSNAHTTPPSTTSTLTITVNSATITAGQSVLLTASGASTYSWSTGATTNSITVSPTITTSYTVTGFNGTDSAKAISVVTINTGTTSTALSDNIEFSLVMYVPSTTLTAFSYRYDTTNIRISLNGQRLSMQPFNIDTTDVGNNVNQIRNSYPKVDYLHMNHGDSLTVEIDSLYYFTSTNEVSMGDMYININAGASLSSFIVDGKFYQSWVTPGHYVGQAPWQTANQTWYLGGKYTYTWKRP